MPVTSTVLPRKYPPASMWSRRGIPLDTRSVKTRYFGRVPKSATSMPWDAMAKGNSLAMNAEPRYLTTLKPRIEARSARRWVSWMMQSDSDSMKLPGGSSPAVDMVTTPATPARSRRSWMRHISPRSTRGSFSITRRTSIPSNTIRLAPISLARNSTAASRPLRSNVPACTAPGDSRPSTNASRGLLRPRFRTRLGISQPKDAALATTCWKPSSKATKMPGSSNRWAPFTNVWRANTVLPDPASPASNVVRPRGNPPPVISSTPSIPVCALARRGSRSFWFLRAMSISVPGLYSNTPRQLKQDPRGGGQPMTRLTRRASLLVALNRLTSAATSYAEWTVPRESECRKWAARVDSKLALKDADGYSTVVPVDRESPLRPHGDFDEFVARTHADPKIDWSRPTGRHRSTVSSRLWEGAHRNILHGAVRHLRDEHDGGARHGPAGRVQEPHGVRLAPPQRYRLAHELPAGRTLEPRRRGPRRRRLRRWRAGDLFGRRRGARTRSDRGARSGSAAAALARCRFRRGTGLFGWSAGVASRGAGLLGRNARLVCRGGQPIGIAG